MSEPELIEAAAAAMLRYERQHGNKLSDDHERQRYPHKTADELLTAHTRTWPEYRRLEHAVQTRANELRGGRLTDGTMDRRGTRRANLTAEQRQQIIADVQRGVSVPEAASRVHCSTSIAYKIVQAARKR